MNRYFYFLIIVCYYNVMNLLRAEAKFDTVQLHTVDVAAILDLLLSCRIRQQRIPS